MPERPGPQPGAGPRAGFGTRLNAAMAARGRLCVGIDPHPSLLADWGLGDSPAGLERLSMTVLESVGDVAAAVKPQVALFERHGSAGMAVLERVLAAAGGSVLTIADAKRGDIGSTMAAYSDAWLRDGSALAADAVTLSPYLGFESLRPALDAAAATGRGVFVLALTSNPEGAAVQHRGGADSVARRIVDAATRENAVSRENAAARENAAGARGGTGADGDDYGDGQCGGVGLVVGATVGDAAAALGIDLGRFNGPILAPGFGAQGARLAEARRTFGAAWPLVLASSSRAVLASGPDAGRLRTAALQARDELEAVEGAGAD